MNNIQNENNNSVQEVNSIEEKKNNNGLILIIIIFIVLVLGLGYIIYDKILSIKTDANVQDTIDKSDDLSDVVLDGFKYISVDEYIDSFKIEDYIKPDITIYNTSKIKFIDEKLVYINDNENEVLFEGMYEGKIVDILDSNEEGNLIIYFITDKNILYRFYVELALGEGEYVQKDSLKKLYDNVNDFSLIYLEDHTDCSSGANLIIDRNGIEYLMKYDDTLISIKDYMKEKENKDFMLYPKCDGGPNDESLEISVGSSKNIFVENNNLNIKASEILYGYTTIYFISNDKLYVYDKTSNNYTKLLGEIEKTDISVDEYRVFEKYEIILKNTQKYIFNS